MPPLPAASRQRLVPIVLAQAIGFACGLASVRLNSRLVPPAALGFYGVFLTFAPIGMWVVHAGLLKFVSRHWAASPHRHRLGREVLAVWGRRLPWLAALAAVGAWVADAHGAVSPVLAWAALLFSAALLTLAALAQTALQAGRAHWRDCAVAASGSLTRSFLPPLFYVAFGGGAAALLAGFGVHAVVMAGAGAWAVRATLGPDSPDAPSGPTLTAIYEGPMFIALALALWALGGINRWLIAWFFGDVAAGYFTLAGGAAAVVTTMLGTVILQYLQPGLFALGDATAPERARLVRRTDLAALVYSAGAGLALAALNFAAPWLVGSLISPAYRDALGWIVPAGCFAIATNLATFYHVMLLAGRREAACGPVDLTTAAILMGGGVLAAASGPEWLARWLCATPILPWVFTRTMARHYFFRPDRAPASAPDP